MKFLISTHNDDAGLFAAFTCLKERPVIVTMYDSYIQTTRGHHGCGVQARRAEDSHAAYNLGCYLVFAGLRDDALYTPQQIYAAFLQAVHLGEDPELWIPAYEEGGHDQHNAVALAFEPLAQFIKGRYYSYTRHGGKTSLGMQVKPEPAWVLQKLKALACYESQITIGALGCWPHFLRDQNEYMELPK